MPTRILPGLLQTLLQRILSAIYLELTFEYVRSFPEFPFEYSYSFISGVTWISIKDLQEVVPFFNPFQAFPNRMIFLRSSEKLTKMPRSQEVIIRMSVFETLYWHSYCHKLLDLTFWNCIRNYSKISKIFIRFFLVFCLS